MPHHDHRATNNYATAHAGPYTGPHCAASTANHRSRSPGSCAHHGGGIVSSPAYTQLLVVQGHDTLLDQLRYKRANHSLHSDLAAVEAEVGAAEARIAEIQKRRHDLERERKRLDDEVAKIQAKRDDINRKLYDGSVTATKDLMAMQEEATSMATRQAGVEDEELEFMEQLESVSGELKVAQAELEDLQGKAVKTSADLEAKILEIDARVEAESATRAADAASVPSELLAAYDRLRSQLGGVAVARLNGGMCDGCHMTLSAVTVDRAKKAPDDAVIHCDECGRLLIV